MFLSGFRRLACGLLAIGVLVSGGSSTDEALAQGKKLKIGVIYDYTGPLAGGGSELHALGAKIMIDYFIKKGGVEGYQIEASTPTRRASPDVAINEAVRLIEQEKVDMLLGFYSSAQCVPALTAGSSSLKKFMWITTCISPPCSRTGNLKYVFRASRAAVQFG
jgi:branched-chain amino acid transport system substrate-binding protein